MQTLIRACVTEAVACVMPASSACTRIPPRVLHFSAIHNACDKAEWLEDIRKGSLNSFAKSSRYIVRHGKNILVGC